MNRLLFYFGESGIAVREVLVKSAGKKTEEAFSEKEFAGALSTVTADAMLSAAVEYYRSFSETLGRCAVLYALPYKLEALDETVRAALNDLPFADSVTRVAFAEVASAAIAAKEGQLLYCGSRETRLFTEKGEVLLSALPQGNGWEDFLLTFAVDEKSTVGDLAAQKDHAYALFRKYRYFSSPVENPDLRVWKKEQRKKRGKGESDPAGPIDYRALPQSEKKKIARREPVFRREPGPMTAGRDNVTIEDAASAFEKILTGLEHAELTHVTVIGCYADFPLLNDYLASLPQHPEVIQEEESLWMLNGLTRVSASRFAHTKIEIRDFHGVWYRLWGGEFCPERTVEIPVLLRKTISETEWQGKEPILPYRLTREIPLFQNRYFEKTKLSTEEKDFKEICYRKEADGSYRLNLPEDGSKSNLQNCVLSLSAKPDGINCRLSPARQDGKTVD